MTDRTIVYTGALPQTLDILNTSKMAMLGDAYLAMATLGNSATAPSQVVAGLTCTPTSPTADLHVVIGPGAIFQLDATDATGYGDLSTDANQIYKMGIRNTTSSLTITPPSTGGFSQVYLVEAILSDIDAGSTVLSYFNAANPAVPWSGPANAGTSNFTTRTCVCTVSLKAGIAAVTGTQLTPAPDVGFVGLYAVTVANGQTQIVSGNIVAQGAGYAPFVNTALPYVPVNSQAGSWMYGVDTGATSAIITNLAPIPNSLVPGMTIRVKMLNPPSGASVINVNGFGNNAIVTTGATPVSLNAWAAGDVVEMTFDGTNWQARGITIAGQPVYLQSNRIFFVNSTIGLDTFDGTTATVTGGHGPFLTLQKAANIAAGFNLNNHNITINVANGTYNFVVPPPVVGAGSVLWMGNTTTPASCLIQGINRCAISCVGGTTHVFQGFKVQTSGTPSVDNMAGIQVAQGSIALNSIEWGPCSGAHNSLTSLGVMNFSQGPLAFFRIAGPSTGNTFSNGCFIEANLNSFANWGSPNSVTTVTIVNTPFTYGAAFVTSSSLSTVDVFNTTFSGGGGVLCQRFQVSANALILTGGTNPATYLPGNAAGSQTTGGQYL